MPSPDMSRARSGAPYPVASDIETAPGKLRLLADWLDEDAAVVPPGTAIQADLRHWADEIENRPDWKVTLAGVTIIAVLYLAFGLFIGAQLW